MIAVQTYEWVEDVGSEQVAFEQVETSILDSAWVREGEDMVVAVVFAPLFGRSARLDTMRGIARRYGGEGRVYVTCDLDLFRKVKKGESGDLRATILLRGSGVVMDGDGSTPHSTHEKRIERADPLILLGKTG